MARLAKVIAILAGAVLLVAPVAWSAHPLATDDAGTEGQGGILVELTGGFGFDRETIEGERVRSRTREAALTLTHGLLDNLDAVVELPYEWQRVKVAGETEKESGLTDMVLAFKWRLVESALGHYALRPAITLPTGNEDRGLGNGRVSYGLTLIGSWEFEPANLHLNLGYARNEYRRGEDRAANRNNLWYASAAVERELNERINLVAEVGAARNEEKGVSRHPAFTTLGAVYAAAERVDLSLGLRLGLTSVETDATVLLGLAWSL